MQNKSWKHIHHILNKKFIFWKISNWSCCIKPWKTLHSSNTFFTQNLTCLLPLWLLLLTFSTSFFIKIQKTTLQNIPNRRFRVYPLSRFRSKNHETIRTRNRNQLTIKKGNTYISYKRQHTVMCTWNTNRSRTQQNLMSKAQQLQETIDSNVCMKH